MISRSIVSGCVLTSLLIITACGTKAPVATAPAAVPPSATPSPSPTQRPSPTPTPTITPTPLPPTPEGAQGFDFNRQLSSKTENGITSFYIPETKGWAVALNQDPIYLINSKNYPSDVAIGLPESFESLEVDYYRMPDSEQPFLTVEEPSSYDTGGWFGGNFSLKAHSWNSTQTFVAMFLAERLNGVSKDGLTADMLNTALRKIANHSLVLALDVPVIAKDNSKVTTKYWDPNNNIDFVQVPWKSTLNDPSYFGRLSVSYHWKLDVRGGEDQAHPGKLVVIFATPYPNRVKHDYNEANKFLLGPIYAALLSQKEPLLDFVSDRVDDLNNFGGEEVWIHSTKGISYKELEGPFNFFDLQDFAFSASGPNPFFKYQCIHFAKDGSQSVIDCYYANWSPAN